MDAQETQQGEITEKAVERLGGVFVRFDFLRGMGRGLEGFLDLGLLNQGVEDVEDRVAGPDQRGFFQQDDFVLGLFLYLAAP
jgi:hypothetical protein